MKILYAIYIAGLVQLEFFAAKYVSKVYGIEIVEEAIKDAKENAKINGISNADFLVGDVENVFDELLKKEQNQIQYL